VVGKTIDFGITVPITGAAPLPFGWQTDVNTVEQWIASQGGLYGRKVSFDIEDDGYDPSTGQAACTKLVDSKPLFVVGWTMPEVELECAQLFSKNKIPYFARGASPNVIQSCSIPICYFLSPSDAIQGTLGADYVMNDMGGAHQKIGMVWENDQPASPNAFVAEVRKKGGSVLVDESSVPRQQDFSSTIVKLQQAGCTVVMLSVAPVDAITISTQAQSMGYHPTWFGLGTYWNYNLVLESAGMAMDGAITFSPWVSIDSAAAAQWRQIYSKYNNGAQADDIGLIIFGLAELGLAVMKAAGPNMSVASVIAQLDDFSWSSPFWAPVSYSTADHMGPTSVCVFRADGQAKRWVQIAGFSSSF
jgi:branched-chain amino acid transport system substrate-binding protein